MNKDNKFFQKIKKGDKQSFEQLFKAYYAPLCLFALKYIKDHDDSEEIVQDFFVRLWEKRNKIRINTSLKSYLFSAIRNKCFNFMKHEKIKLIHQNDHYNSIDSPIDSSCFMEVGLVEKIDKSIASLPKRRREIFILSREKGLKYREIADKLGISIKTVEAQMGHALKELRKQLKDYKQQFIFFRLFHEGSDSK